MCVRQGEKYRTELPVTMRSGYLGVKLPTFHTFLVLDSSPGTV